MKKLIIISILSASFVALNAMSPSDQLEQALQAGQYDQALNILGSKIRSSTTKYAILGGFIDRWSNLSEAQQQRVAKLITTIEPKYQQDLNPKMQQAIQNQLIDTIRQNMRDQNWDAALKNIAKLSDDNMKAQYLSRMIDSWNQLNRAQRKTTSQMVDQLRDPYKQPTQTKLRAAANRTRKEQEAATMEQTMKIKDQEAADALQKAENAYRAMVNKDSDLLGLQLKALRAKTDAAKQRAQDDLEEARRERAALFKELKDNAGLFGGMAAQPFRDMKARVDQEMIKVKNDMKRKEQDLRKLDADIKAIVPSGAAGKEEEEAQEAGANLAKAQGAFRNLGNSGKLEEEEEQAAGSELERARKGTEDLV